LVPAPNSSALTPKASMYSVVPLGVTCAMRWWLV
jgi:hypothetical protein